MSVTGKLTKNALELLSKRKSSRTPGEDKGKPSFVMPTDSKALYRGEMTADGTECLIVRSKRYDKEPAAAVLFLCGNGMHKDRGLRLAALRKLADETGAEVWVPNCTPAEDAPLTAAIDVLFETYRAMLQQFPAEKITVSGDSLGGTCVLGMLSAINGTGGELPMPGLVVLHSPAGLPANEVSWARAGKLAEKDPVFTAETLKNFPETVACDGRDLPDYVLHPALGDYRGAPETFIYYGAEETVSVLAPGIEQAFARGGACCRIRLVPDMIHGFSAYPVLPEGREAFAEWTGEIRELSGEARPKLQAKSYFTDHRRSLLAHHGYMNLDYHDTIRVVKKLRHRESLIDIGCGSGAFLVLAAKELPDTALYGLDLAPGMVKEAGERLGERGKVFEGDAEHMPLDDGSFAIVTCHMSIHHYPEPRKALEEMYRILKPGGTLLVNDMNGPEPVRKLANIWFPKLNAGDVAVYSEEEIRTMAEAAGFRVMRYSFVSPFSFLLVARKDPM